MSNGSNFLSTSQGNVVVPPSRRRRSLIMLRSPAVELHISRYEVCDYEEETCFCIRNSDNIIMPIHGTQYDDMMPLQNEEAQQWKYGRALMRRRVRFSSNREVVQK